MRKIFIVGTLLCMPQAFAQTSTTPQNGASSNKSSATDVSNKPTKEDAEALVKQAIDFLKANGRDKFIKEVMNPTGKFHFQEGSKKGLYIFVYDEKGTVVAHGVRMELTGRPRWNDTDAAGKYFVREWTEMVKNKDNKCQCGWQDYKEFNPAEKNKTMQKTSYVQLVDGLIVGCGIYK